MFFDVDSIANRLILQAQKNKESLSECNDTTRYQKLINCNTVGLRLPRQSGKTFWSIRRALSYRNTLVLVSNESFLKESIKCFENQLIKVEIPEEVRKRLITIEDFIKEKYNLNDIDTIIIDDYNYIKNHHCSEEIIYNTIVKLKGDVIVFTVD